MEARSSENPIQEEGGEEKKLLEKVALTVAKAFSKAAAFLARLGL